MRRTIKRVAFALLVGFTLGLSRRRTDHDVVVTQQRAGVLVTRIFAGPDGQSHAEEILMKLARADMSTEMSELSKATGVQFRRQAPT